MVIIIFNFKMVVKQKKRIPPFLSLVIPSSDINRYQSPGYSINQEYAMSLPFSASVSPTDTSVALTLRPRNVSR